MLFHDRFLIRCLDILLSISLIVICMPFWSLRALYKLYNCGYKHVFDIKEYQLSEAKKISCVMFADAYLPRSFLFFHILTGNLSFAGNFLNLQSNPSNGLCDSFYANCHSVKSGFYSVSYINSSTGMLELTPSSADNPSHFNVMSYISLLTKGVICDIFFISNGASNVSKFSLFGIQLNNLTMPEAIDWVTDVTGSVKVAHFINVNSINLCDRIRGFNDCLNSSDANFIDGSGMRIAARSFGYQLKDNVNGTDLLPLLCERLSITQQSLYLLGAGHGIAEKTAANLSLQYPKLKIAGCHHGQFDIHHCDNIIHSINSNDSDIVLVALGSPLQESFINTYKQQLQCQTVLAVGGLFDFYSGQVSRSPLWLRQLGCEWIWRLLKQPKKKFRRYVFGNPWFLFKLLIAVMSDRFHG